MQLERLPPSNVDLELGIQTEKVSCWRKYVVRDFTQYILGFGGVEGLGGVGYGLLSGNYPLAAFSGSLSLISFIGCWRVWHLKPLHDFEKNVEKIKKQARLLYQSNQELSRNIEDLKNQSRALQLQKEAETANLKELNLAFISNISQMSETIKSLRETEQKYHALEEMYVKIKGSFELATAEIQRFSKEKNKIPHINISIEKDVEDLSVHIREFDSENQELTGLLSRFSKELDLLETTLARIVAEKEALQKAAQETRKIDESDDKYKNAAERMASTVDRLEKLNTEFLIRIKDMETIFNEILPLIQELSPEAASKIQEFLNAK